MFSDAVLSALQQHQLGTITTPEPPILLGDLNDTWLAHEIQRIIAQRSATHATIVRMLHEIKAEPMLAELFAPDTFGPQLLADTLTYAGQRMIDAFAAACVQHNPHIDYLKVSVHLGACLMALQQRTADVDAEHFVLMLPTVRAHLSLVDKLRTVAVRYVDTDTLQRFVAKHLCTGAQLQRYAGMLSGVLCAASGLLTDGGVRSSSAFVLLELLCCAELILKHVEQKHSSSSVQQHQVNNGGVTQGDDAATVASSSSSSSVSPHDDNKRRDGWLQSVHDMLAHLAASTAFDRTLNEYARPLDATSCTSDRTCRTRSQQAVWVAQCVMMWRRRTNDDGGGGSNGVEGGAIDNVMVSKHLCCDTRSTVEVCVNMGTSIPLG